MRLRILCNVLVVDQYAPYSRDGLAGMCAIDSRVIPIATLTLKSIISKKANFSRAIQGRKEISRLDLDNDFLKMATEYRVAISDAHPKPILAIALNPVRREVYTGSEDGGLRIFESESGKFIGSFFEHRGPITSLTYLKEAKLLFSGSIDGSIIVWGNNGKVLQRMDLKSPIYSLAFFARRQQLIAGLHGKVRVFQVQVNDENPALGGDIIESRSLACAEHSDIVKVVLACEGRFYSAGYDRKIVIYNTPSHSETRLKVLNVVHKAHEAAITSLIYAKDAENSWIISGSFDRTVVSDVEVPQRFSRAYCRNCGHWRVSYCKNLMAFRTSIL
jgi:WD40 repeat protein